MRGGAGWGEHANHGDRDARSRVGLIHNGRHSAALSEPGTIMGTCPIPPLPTRAC